MLSALLLSSLLGAGPDVGAGIREVRRAFIADGEDRVSASATHRVVSHPDGSLELQGVPALRFSLQSVGRDFGQPCRAGFISREADPAAPRTVRTLRACGLEETWSNEFAGLEHTFTVQRPPRGQGGLRLRLAVDGPWHHRDADGHVFGGPGAADQLRYGNAFVVRDGQRLPIAVVRVEGGLELRVPRRLVDAPGAFPMLIDPRVTAEYPLAPGLEYGPLSSMEAEPAIAINSTGLALVAWTDNRRQLQTDIFAARVERSGLVDQTGLPVTTEPGHQRHPAVSWDGTTFVVAWEHEVLDGGEIRARAISPNGQLANAVSVAPGTEPVLAGVADGGFSVLAWVDGRTQVRAARLTGTTMSTPYAVLPNLSSGARPTHPAVAASGRAAFVTWEEGVPGVRTSSIKGHWLGTTTPTLIDISATDAGDMRLPTVALVNATQDEDAFVLWEDGIGILGTELKGGIGVGSVDFPGRNPTVARTSNDLGMAGATVGLITTAGEVAFKDPLAPTLYRVPGSGARVGELAIASHGSNVVGVWTHGSGPRDVRGARFELPLANITVQIEELSTAAGNQLDPHVALQGEEGLAVWRDGVNSVAGAEVRLSADGATFGSRFPLVSRLQPVEQLDVAAGANGQYLVTWRQSDLIGSAVGAQLATRNGFVGAPIALSAQAVAGPAVAWNPASGVFVVAWVDQPLLQQREVVSTTIDPQGVALLPPGVWGTDPATDVDVSCLANGKCLLAWEVRSLRRVNTLLLGASSPTPLPVTNALQPALAHDGTDFFLGWRGPSVGTQGATTLSIARVDPTSGVVSSPAWSVVPQTGSTFGSLSLAPGVPPVAVWGENAGDASKLRVMQLGSPAVLLANTGQLPIVATAGAQGVLVYQRYDDGIDARSMRAYGSGIFLDVDVRDAGIDAGVADAGANVDAGVDGGVDGGVQADGGVVRFGTSGCGCDSASGAPVVLLALLAFWRRRQA